MARPNIRDRVRKVTRATGPSPSSSADGASAPQGGDPHTKQAKRSLKHDNLIRRAHNSSISTGRHSSGVQKRRRPAKKLAGVDAAGLSRLASALDDALADSPSAQPSYTAGQEHGKTHLRANLAINPTRGVQRRKERVNTLERERFSNNLAVMNSGATSGGGTSPDGTKHSRAQRWSALRRHIAASMPSGS